MVALLLCSVAAAQSPWIAELSDSTPAKANVCCVTIPLGSHVAFGVYGTSAVKPPPTDDLAITVRTIWYEPRDVFVGMPGDRREPVPFYFPRPGDFNPQTIDETGWGTASPGSWVVEVTPARTGTFRLQIECDSQTDPVTAVVRCVRVRPSQIGYGFYVPIYSDLTREREYLRDMADHGMNTIAAYAREVDPRFGYRVPGWDQKAWQNLAWRIDTAFDVGLIDRRVPLICLSIDPEDIPRTRDAAKHRWPELIAYNRDEPQPEDAQTVADCAGRAHNVGARSGTAINGQFALQFGDPLDVWIIHMDSLTREVISEAKRRGKELWVYNCALRATNAAQHRYWTGVYTWATGAKVSLTWAYMHEAENRIQPDGRWTGSRTYGVATCDRAGFPIPTPALEGMQEGVIDSRFLQALERRDTPDGNKYLADLRASVDLGFWTDGIDRDGSNYVWDVPDTQVPPIDSLQVRKDVLRLLGL